MRVEELDYELPRELIAQVPTPEREAARLLVVEGDTPAHRCVRDLPALLSRPSLLVFNDTRVIPARLLGHRPTGGKVELLLLEPLVDARPHAWKAMARPAKSLRPDTRLAFPGLTGVVLGRDADGTVRVAFEAEGDVGEALDRAGQMPLPPYIERAADSADEARYQTVFARARGAVAAPTAGLHFGEALMRGLTDAGHALAYVTLHVGPGTFAPLKVDDLDVHPMHAERFALSQACVDAIAAARAEGRPVVAVGTTVVRTLEAVYAQYGELRAGEGITRLLIQPPYAFGVVDALVTNFHLPRSTLLALVMAFAGVERTRAAYAEAVRGCYRFFSYGDAMFIPQRQAP